MGLLAPPCRDIPKLFRRFNMSAGCDVSQAPTSPPVATRIGFPGLLKASAVRGRRSRASENVGPYTEAQARSRCCFRDQELWQYSAAV